MIEAPNQIHPHAQIGKDVSIGPFTTIADNVVIGDGTWIGPHVTIMPGARIGRHCQIFPGAVVSTITQDMKFRGGDSLVEIGDHSVVREFVTINRGTLPGSATIIGKHVLLMAYVHVAHDCIIGDHCVLANVVQLAGHVELGNHVKIGGTAALRQFVKVGEHAMVGGGSLVRKDIPPFVKAAREPVKYCGLNVVGLQRQGFTTQQIATIQQIYHFIFQQDFTLVEALQKVEEQVPACAEKDTVLNFIRRAGLGIIR
jgi:UDP-N-acetylglucosamine acyltransferase